MSRKVGLTKRQRLKYMRVLDGTAANLYYWRTWWYWGRRTPNSDAWCAYLFALDHPGRSGYDAKKLQSMVLAGGPEVVYRYARDVEGANVRRLQERMVEIGDPAWIRTFSDNIPKADRRYLLDHLAVASVLAR